MKARTFACLYLLLLILYCIPLTSSAQNEIQRERSALKGIAEMGLALNLETNVSLNEKGELEITSIRDAVTRSLTDAEIPVIPDKEVRSSDQIPFLYMHINTMDAGQGLVPFSISLRFYQPVKLMLNRDQQTSASTWETGMVGIVSYDKMEVIQQSAVTLLQDFIDDFNSVNL